MPYALSIMIMYTLHILKQAINNTSQVHSVCQKSVNFFLKFSTKPIIAT